MKRFARALVVLLVGLTIAGCKKKEGEPCTTGMQLCVDKSSALVCRGNTLTPVRCAGPLGCAKFQDHVNCDTSASTAGSLCMGEDEEYACSVDKKEALHCGKGRQFETYLQCRGPSGCLMNGRLPMCDLSVAAKGDPCKTPATFACSDDGKQMLVCRIGKFETHRYCRGQYGCATKTDGPACDESVSLAGDPCGIAGQLVCSVDGKTELICQGGVYTKSRACKTSCSIASRGGRTVECN